MAIHNETDHGENSLKTHNNKTNNSVTVVFNVYAF